MYIVIVIIWVANKYLLQQFRNTSLCISIAVEEWDDVAAVVEKIEVVSEDSFIL
jgi:hypothetical protein